MSLLFQLLIIFLTVFYFYSQSDILARIQSAETNDKSAKNSEAVGQVIKNFSLTEYKLNSVGQKDWKLMAGVAQNDPILNVWNIQQSEVLLFKQNQQMVRINAPVGSVDAKTKNLVLKEEVLSETLSGYKFKSVGLNYNSLEEKFNSEGQIEIEGPNKSTVLNGTSFSGDLKLGQVDITGPIYCEQAIPNYDKPIIKSKNASIDIENRHVTFTGQVLILVGDMTITAEEAEFEYNKIKGDLEVLIVRGRVFASQPKQSASADILEIRVKEGFFLFQGNPRFVSGENTLVGQEILLYNKGQSVQILNGRVKTESEINLIENQ